MKRMSILTASALALIATPFLVGHEAIEEVGYVDMVGVPTACAGHTATAVVGKRYSIAECEQLLADDIANVSHAPMARHIKVPMSEDEQLAVASLVFNVGAQAIAPGKSTLLRELNAGRYRQACDQILQWRNADGVDCSKNGSGCAGIWKRRLEERDICLYGSKAVKQRYLQP